MRFTFGAIFLKRRISELHSQAIVFAPVAAGTKREGIGRWIA
jgi:hypothetical protein